MLPRDNTMPQSKWDEDIGSAKDTARNAVINLKYSITANAPDWIVKPIQGLIMDDRMPIFLLGLGIEAAGIAIQQALGIPIYPILDAIVAIALIGINGGIMFNKLRIKLKTMLKGTQRNPETKFINPYAMSEPTTPQYRVKPEFKDGRFILKKEELMHEKKEKSELESSDVNADTSKNKPVVKKEPGFLKFLSDVVAADLKSLSREERRKAKELQREEKAFKDFKARRVLEEKRVYDEFLKSREEHKKAKESFITAEEKIEFVPPALECELLPAVEIQKETIVPEVVEPAIVMQPVYEITGNDITVLTLKRTLDRWKTFEPKVAKK